jgi:hypothetical protein
MTETKDAADERRREILHISEADFRNLPRSVRMLMRAYSKPAASGQEGLIVLELQAYRWPEIDSEMKSVAARIQPMQGRGRLKKAVRYANDYECAKDGAAWSRVGCTSARKERCPVCHEKVKPVAVERYVVVEWTPVLPSLWSKLGSWLPIP